MNKEYLIETYKNKNEVNWNNVSKALIDENGWNSVPYYESFAQLVFIKYYGFIVRLTTKEKDPWVATKQDGGPVYLDSCLEAFFLFDDEGYINLENNSLGKRLQGFGMNRHNRRSILDFGLLSKPQKKENEWSITIEIPFKKLQKIYQKLDVSSISSGFSFKGNFYKTGKNPINGIEHYYMWNRINTPTPDFHQPSQFGILKIK